jgi:hypothetical protein
MTLSVVLHTSSVSAEATVERLRGAGIEAVLLERPNAIVRVLSGGNYRVGVAVPESDLERARAELARWELEAAPRVRAMARAAGVGIALASLPAVVLTVWFLARPPRAWGWWYSVLAVWGAGVWLWGVRSRRQAERDA